MSFTPIPTGAQKCPSSLPRLTFPSVYRILLKQFLLSIHFYSLPPCLLTGSDRSIFPFSRDHFSSFIVKLLKRVIFLEQNLLILNLVFNFPTLLKWFTYPSTIFPKGVKSNWWDDTPYSHTFLWLLLVHRWLLPFPLHRPRALTFSDLTHSHLSN